MGSPGLSAQALTCREMPGEGCGRCVTCSKIADGNHEDLYMVEPDDTTAAGRQVRHSIKDAAGRRPPGKAEEKTDSGRP